MLTCLRSLLSRAHSNYLAQINIRMNERAEQTADVLGKLGCPGCHSGRVLDFVTLDEFVVDPATLDVSSVAVGLG